MRDMSILTRRVGARERLLSALVVFMLAFTLVPTAGHAEETQAVTADKNGVLDVILYYVGDDGTTYPLQAGTGFLINNDYLITCYHVVNPGSDTAQATSEYFGSDFRDHLVAKAVVMRDLEIELIMENQSEATDFSIMKLKQPINDRTPLKLGDSEKSAQTEAVHALGFPDVSTNVGAETTSTFTTSDVTVESGTISKIMTGSDGVDYIQHSAKISSGNSGGPLVDDTGAVVGVNKGTAIGGFFEAGYYYALSINQVKAALDALGIAYESGTGGGGTPTPNPDPNGEPVDPGEVDKAQLTALINDFTPLASDLSKYTEESANAFTAALTAAKAVLDDAEATQAQVDSSITSLNNAQRGLTEKPAPPLALIIGGAAAVIVIIAAVIIIIVVNSKKKKRAPVPSATLPGPTGAASPLPAGTTSVAQQPQYTPANVPDSGSTATSVYTPPSYTPTTSGFDAAGSGETTVLNPAVGETSLLGGAQVAGSLRRVSNGEKVRIDRAEFIIGKERSKVNYVIPDNGTISRQHAKITQRGGQFFVTDLRATNFTFVNDKKIAPGTEVPLSNGDRIKLADEEFILEL